MTQAIHLKISDTYQITLKGMGSAGYVWQYSIEGDEHAITVERIDSTEPAGPLMGQSANWVFEIRAVAQGSANLTFVQRRQWEQNVPTRDQKRFLITVSSQ
jgi:predicted secreted protein